MAKLFFTIFINSTMLITPFTGKENYPMAIGFGHKADIPLTAKKYLKARRKYLLKNNPSAAGDLSRYNAERLEGIQNGINIFEGLSFKQIAFFIKHATEIVLKRGCNNMCSHCFAKATPYPYKTAPQQLDKIPFEDYKNFCNGIKELNNRMGFKVFDKSEYLYNTLFHDADSSMITLTDKEGKVYDYADLAKMLHDATGRAILFDTAGWNIQDTKTQARMEALVNKIISSKKYNYMRFFVSLNPFHSIYSLALKQEKSGNIESAKKLKDAYTDRMANVIYTLLPLRNMRNSVTKDSCLGFIIRALPNSAKIHGRDTQALDELLGTIYYKVVTTFQTKSSAKNEVNITINDLLWLAQKLNINNCTTTISAVGRAADMITDKNIRAYKETLKDLYNNAAKSSKSFEDGILDLNGNFYITNWVETYPTDITINYNTKGKPTALIYPTLRDKVITKDLM